MTKWMEGAGPVPLETVAMEPTEQGGEASSTVSAPLAGHENSRQMGVGGARPALLGTPPSPLQAAATGWMRGEGMTGDGADGGGGREGVIFHRQLPSIIIIPKFCMRFT